MSHTRRWFWLIPALMLGLVSMALGAAESVQAAVPVVEQPSFLERLWDFVGRFHPAVVHMPIGLITMAAIAVTLNWKWPDHVSIDVAFYCLLIGAAATVPATIMGFSIADSQGFPGIWSGEEHEIFWHRWGGVIVTIVGLALAAIAIKGRFNPESKANNIWRIGALVLAGMVGLVGHDGGGLSYGHNWYSEPWEEIKPPTETLIEPTDDGKIDFVKHIAPIFEDKCVECHGPKKPKGEFQMHTKALFFEGSESTKDKTTGWHLLTTKSRLTTPEKNFLVYTFRESEEDGDDYLMPPKKKKNPVSDKEMEAILDWIEQGASWPDGHELEIKE